MSGTGKLSFGFSKTATKPKLIKPVQVTDEFEASGTAIDYLTSFEDSVAKSKVTISNDGPVIPLRISESNIREKLKKKYIKAEPTDELTAEALQALTSENVGDFDMKPNLGNTEAIVAPPKGEEEDTIDDADYEQIPIEKFGLALLKGMGLKEEDLKTNSTSDDYVAKVRLKGLGLGADPEVLKRAREAAQRPVGKDDVKLSWKVGSKCQIIFGRHNGQYGSVEGFDGDIGRVVIKLAASKRIVKVMQATARLVTKAEFEKYGNYLNMDASENFKENGVLPTEPKESRSNRRGVHNDTEMYEFSAKRRKEDPSYSERRSTWLRNGLIVRYLDKKSKYHLQKVTVVSVSISSSSSARCSCEASSGRILRDVKEKYVQTTVPKRPGEALVVVRGPYAGEVGKLVERDDRSSQVRVTICSSKKDVQIDCDDVCCFDVLT